MARKCLCSPRYEAVCGTDGNTYSNICWAHCAKVLVVKLGECDCKCGSSCKIGNEDGFCQRDETCGSNAPRNCDCIPQADHPDGCPVAKCLQKPGCKLVTANLEVPWIRVPSIGLCCPKQCHMECGVPKEIQDARKVCKYPNGCANCGCMECALSGGCAWHKAGKGHDAFCRKKCLDDGTCLPSAVARKVCQSLSSSGQPRNVCQCTQIDYHKEPYIPVCGS